MNSSLASLKFVDLKYELQAEKINTNPKSTVNVTANQNHKCFDRFARFIFRSDHSKSHRVRLGNHKLQTSEEEEIVTKAKSFTFQRANRIEMFILISLNDMFVFNRFSRLAVIVDGKNIDFNDRHDFFSNFLGGQ